MVGLHQPYPFPLVNVSLYPFFLAAILAFWFFVATTWLKKYCQWQLKNKLNEALINCLAVNWPGKLMFYCSHSVKRSDWLTHTIIGAIIASFLAFLFVIHSISIRECMMAWECYWGTYIPPCSSVSDLLQIRFLYFLPFIISCLIRLWFACTVWERKCRTSMLEGKGCLSPSLKRGYSLWPSSLMMGFGTVLEFSPRKGYANVCIYHNIWNL